MKLRLILLMIGVALLPAAAQISSNATKLRGNAICNPSTPVTDGTPLVWNAAGKCWRVGGNVAVGTTVLLDAIWGLLVHGQAYTTSPTAVQQVGFYDNNAAGAMTFTLPSLATFDFSTHFEPQFCFSNSVGKSGVITIQAPASTTMSLNGVAGSVAGTYVSSGALGDSTCVRGTSATTYKIYPGSGAWTNN